MARFFLRLSQMFFYRGLSTHAGVIGPWQPEHLESVHPGTPGQHILDRVIQNMTKRQDAGDVRWRYDNRKRRFGRMNVRAKICRLEPARVPLLLDGGWFVSFRQLRHGEGMMRGRCRIAK